MTPPRPAAFLSLDEICTPPTAEAEYDGHASTAAATSLVRRSRPEGGAFGLGFALTTVTCRRRAREPERPPPSQDPLTCWTLGSTSSPLEPTIRRVRVIGELDLATAPQLREVLTDLVALCGLHVTLDLSELAFIDSSGLSVLVTGLKRLRAAGESWRFSLPTQPP